MLVWCSRLMDCVLCGTIRYTSGLESNYVTSLYLDFPVYRMMLIILILSGSVLSCADKKIFHLNGLKTIYNNFSLE